jgi:hypothetical protein
MKLNSRIKNKHLNMYTNKQKIANILNNSNLSIF